MTYKEKLIKKYNIKFKKNDILLLDDEEDEVSIFDTYLVNKNFVNVEEMCKCALELFLVEQNITRLNYKTKGNKDAANIVEEIHLLDSIIDNE
jgi:hypothetical protein